jgi:hypothetical protein
MFATEHHTPSFMDRFLRTTTTAVLRGFEGMHEKKGMPKIVQKECASLVPMSGHFHAKFQLKKLNVEASILCGLIV